MSSRPGFLDALRATFRGEAEEHLQVLGNGLDALARTLPPDQQRDRVEAMFRAAHSLKGAARAVDLGDVEAACQQIEERLARWHRGGIEPDDGERDAVQRALDRVVALLERAAVPAASAAPASSRPPIEPVAADSVRIPLTRLDAQLADVEELIGARLASAQRASELDELHRRVRRFRRRWAALSPRLHALRHGLAGSVDAPLATADLAGLFEHLDAGRDFAAAVDQRLASLRHDAERDAEALSRRVDALLDASKQMLLLPFSTIAAVFPALVREASRALGKDVVFTLRGEQVAVDKRILEQLKDPLIHLLRNAVAHGIEAPDARAAAGKPRHGTITVEVAMLDVRRVRIVVDDDGAGIDAEAVRAAAVARGLLGAAEADALAAEAVLPLVFESHLSTRADVGALAGRGLGLAIVRDAVERIGGEISIDSRRGLATRFELTLPVTRTSFRGVLVEVAGREFVLPTARVERVARVDADALITLNGRLALRGGERPLPLRRLADLLALRTPPPPPPAGRPYVVIGSGEQRIAVLVDAIVDEQELLLKDLPPPLRRVPNVTALTLLASARLAPVLDVGDLLDGARRASADDAPVAAAAAAPASPRTILVAEDSITSRLLLRAVLEAAGYRVVTAADGVEAFTQLRAQHFDALVSDVEMPRLGGFDLTARVRADRRLHALPVVLVTALHSQADRERGFDVGADAYIAKASFDQQALLDALHRLLPP